MLYIFGQDEKLISVLPQGSFFDPVHQEVLNGENVFKFSFPADQAEAQYIQEGNLVGFRDLDAYWQFFEIKRIVDQHGDGLTRTAFCEHIFYELLDDIVTDKRPSAGALAALDSMLEGTRWQVGIVDDLGAANASVYYEPVLSGVQKVANAWQGELRWRVVVTGNQITGRYVDLVAMRGTDTGKQFAYAKDILNIEREVDTSSLATALYGRGKGVETESGDGYGRRLTFADVAAPDKPLGQEWVGDNEALARWGRGGRHRFDVFIDEDEEDPVKLLEKTRAELTRRKDPRVTYRLDVVSLEQLTGYEHEQVRLGDLVRVIDREFKPELVVSARVIEIDRDLLAPENTKVVLGSFAPTIVEATVNIQRRVNEMASKPYNTKWLDGVIDVLQNTIENTEAYIWETPQGTLHLNAPTYEQATEAMLLGGGRFAIANQKDGQGGWNWRTFGDGSGFTADEITTGKLKAELVQIGPETTFAPGYDPTQIEGSVSVGMGVNEHCVGLWHLDGSLNSHKGNPATLDGATVFEGGCFGQAVNLIPGKLLRVPTDGMNGDQGTLSLRIKNLSASPDGGIIMDIPKADGSKNITVGISQEAGHEGEVYISDSETISVSYSETTQADFDTGTLTRVKSTPANNLELVPVSKPTFTRNSEAFKSNDVKVPANTPRFDQVNIALGRTVTSSDGSTSPDRSFVVDGDVTTGRFFGTGSGLHYVTVDLGSPAKKINKIKVWHYWGDGRTYYGTKTQVSSDGTNWTTVFDSAESGTYVETFDGHTIVLPSLMTVRYIRDYINGNSVNDNNHWVQIQAFHFKNDGVFMEEGTQNLQPDPLFYSGVVDYNDWNGPGTVAVVNGICQMRNFAATSQYLAIRAVIPIIANSGTYTVSMKCRTIRGGTKPVNIYMGSQYKLAGYPSPTGAWTILSATFQNGEYTTNPTQHIRIDGGHDLDILWVQTEKKDYPTSITEDTRQPDVLTIPATTLSPSQGSVSLWVRIPSMWSASYPGWKRLWSIGGSASAGMFVFRYNPDTNTMVFGIYNNSGVATEVSCSRPNINDLTHFVLTWSSAEMAIYQNGSKVNFLSSPSLPTFFAENVISVGCRQNNGGDQPNAFIYDFRTFDQQLTSTEIFYLYSLQGNSPVTGDTTYLLGNSGDKFKIGMGGTRVKVVDISTSHPALSSNINWLSTVPNHSDFTVLVSLSTNGGATYSTNYQALNGQAIPNIDQATPLSNARLKITEVLTTDDVDITPQLHSLFLALAKELAKTSYGQHKSTLTDWDSIALAWDQSRICLVVNDQAQCYLDNPAVSPTIANYINIGNNLSLQNPINTLIDEVRLDKIYQAPDVRIAWHKTGSPFYTSEEMATWPGYIKIDTEGLKVYDSQANLRVLLGSWLENMVREYGLYTVGGRIYSALISTLEPGQTGKSIELLPNGELNIRDSLGRKAVSLYGGSGNGSLEFYYDGVYHSVINAGASTERPLYMSCSRGFRLFAGASRYFTAFEGGSSWVEWNSDSTYIDGNLLVQGTLLVYKEPKNYLEITENYGAIKLNCIEGPEVKNFDEGKAWLMDGECRIDIDPIFLECIEPDTELTPWLFQATPMFDGSIYVAECGADYFIVRSRGNEPLSGPFCWTMTATRKGFAGHRFEEMPIDDLTMSDNWEDEILQEVVNDIDWSALDTDWEDEIMQEIREDSMANEKTKI